MFDIRNPTPIPETDTAPWTQTVDPPAHQSAEPRPFEADPAVMPTERIEAELCELSAHIAAAEARWMALVAEFDRRNGWAHWGMHSCAHWLSWRCAVSLNAARERVRVANALVDLPLTMARFMAGELTYAKVRALTRIATPADEHDLLELAHNTTASQLELIVRAWRRSERSRENDRAKLQQQIRSLSAYDNDVGNLAGKFCLTPEDGETFMNVIDELTAPPPTAAERADVSAETSTLAQRRADALMALVELAAETLSRGGTGERIRPIVEIEQPVLTNDEPGKSEIRGGVGIAPETARRLHCDSTEIVAGGKPTKTIPRHIRRALARRDKNRCQFPGCSHSRRVDAHHIQPRSQQGSHDLESLVTLCPFHHHCVHEGGYNVHTTDGVVFTFAKPDGTEIPANPRAPTATSCAGSAGIRTRNAARGLAIAPDTVSTGTGERLDLDLTLFAIGTHKRPFRE